MRCPGSTRRLQTTLLVLASSSGFTRTARQAAEAKKVVLAEPGVADESVAEEVARRFGNLQFMTLGFRPRRGSVEVEGDASRVDARHDLPILGDGGKQVCTLYELSVALVKNSDTMRPVMDGFRPDTGWVEMHLPSAPGLFVQDREGMSLRLTAVNLGVEVVGKDSAPSCSPTARCSVSRMAWAARRPTPQTRSSWSARTGRQ